MTFSSTITVVKGTADTAFVTLKPAPADGTSGNDQRHVGYTDAGGNNRPCFQGILVDSSWNVPIRMEIFHARRDFRMCWGLIGASTTAGQHNVGTLRGTCGEVVAVASTTETRPQEDAAAYGITVERTSVDDHMALPTMQAVYISFKNEKHHAYAMAALRAGKHRLSEEPPRLTMADTAESVTLAESSGLVFAPNHHLRCSPSHRAIRGLIAFGRVGEVLSLRIFDAAHRPTALQGRRINDAAAGEGVINNVTLDDADKARFRLAEAHLTVVAEYASSGIEQGAEGSVMSVWTVPSGILPQSHEGFSHTFAGSRPEVHGTNGSIFAKGLATRAPMGEIMRLTAARAEVVSCQRHDLPAQGSRKIFTAAAGHGRPAATERDSIAALAATLAVRDAARLGIRQTVDYGRAA